MAAVETACLFIVVAALAAGLRLRCFPRFWRWSMSKASREFFEGGNGGSIELPKEAVLHAMHDERNIPEAPTIEDNVIRHVQGDMTPAHVAASMSPEVGLGETIRGIGGDIWDALTPAFTLGAEEFTRAMYTGNAYVFHGDTIPHEQSHHELPHHGLPVEPMQKQADIEREM